MKKSEYIQKIKNNYLRATSYNFNKVIALQDVSDGINVSGTIENFLDENPDNKFKIELLMFPSWASKSKVYKVFGERYTHIRIKKDF